MYLFCCTNQPKPSTMKVKEQRKKLFLDLAKTYVADFITQVEIDDDGDIEHFDVSAQEGTIADRLGVLYGAEDIAKLAIACNLSMTVVTTDDRPHLIIR